MALTFKLAQLQSKATQASRLVSKQAPLYYKQLLEQNKHCIQEPPTVEKFNLLSKQLFYTRLASIPGRYEAFQKEMDYVKRIWKNWNELKIEDVDIATLFGLECFAWYCAGEIVGRGFTFTGYHCLIESPRTVADISLEDSGRYIKNMWSEVYDALVDAIEHVSEYEGTSVRVDMGSRVPSSASCPCCLALNNVVHKMTDIPKPRTKKSAESANGEDNVHVSSSR